MKKTYLPVLLIVCSAVAYADEFPRLDAALPTQTDITGFVPIFDFDSDGCYPATGISRTGLSNPGLNATGTVEGACRDAGFLDISNTLHRYACMVVSGVQYCGHVFDMYFEKDQAAGGSFAGGHRHDWETVAVWTQAGAVTHVGYSSHGKMTTKPIGEVPRDGNHVKIVYHKDGASTHCFRFAKDNNEAPENPYKSWVTPAVASWYELTGDGVNNQAMRTNLNAFDFGSASLKINDTQEGGSGNGFLNFLNNNGGKPSGYPTFTQESIEASNPNLSKKDGMPVEGADKKAASKKDGMPVKGEGKSGVAKEGR